MILRKRKKGNGCKSLTCKLECKAGKSELLSIVHGG